jgi:Zn-finger nucleic acid-binding protein
MSRDALRELLDDALHALGESAPVATGANLTQTPGELFCPVCPEFKLDVIRLRGVEVERCPSCRGILFDPGELQTLEDRTSSPVPLAVSNRDRPPSLLVELPLAALGLLLDLLGS